VTRTMTHDEALAELGAAALESLPADEYAAVLAHARSCTSCRPELEALRGVGAAIALAAPVAPMRAERSAALRARLVARAAADQGRVADVVPLRPASAAASPVTGGVSPGANRWRWMAIAASVALVVSVANQLRLLREHLGLLERVEAMQVAQGTSADEVRRLTQRASEQKQLVDALTGPSVKIFDLVSSSRQEPGARMFWDRATQRWTMFAHNLPQPGAGKTFQLWLVTPGSKISAGTFAPNANGDAVVSATYALDPTQLRAIAVTEEPAGGVPQPTGPFVVSVVAQ
jgi:hypothetical protein